MRKSIAKSKFHQLQVQHYTAQVYTKGAGRVKDVPFLLEKRLQKEGVDSSTVFLSESVSEITFDQPNTMQERGDFYSQHRRGEQHESGSLY